MAAAAGDDEIPNSFLCPITSNLMVDPVVAADGHTYEREAIEEWLRRGHNTSPLTNLRMERRLVANHALRKSIEEFVARQNSERREELKREQVFTDLSLAIRLREEEVLARFQKLEVPAQAQAQAQAQARAQGEPAVSGSSTHMRGLAATRAVQCAVGQSGATSSGLSVCDWTVEDVLDADLAVLSQQYISGAALPEIKVADLAVVGMRLGPATVLVKAAKQLGKAACAGACTTEE